MKPTILHAWVLVMASTLAPSVGAQDTSDLDKCISEQPSTVDIAKCLYAIYRQEDIYLNQIYPKAIAQAKEVSAETASELKKSELAWVKFRDSWCAFEARWEGGTGAKIAGAYCLALTTRKRNIELRFYAGEAELGTKWRR